MQVRVLATPVKAVAIQQSIRACAGPPARPAVLCFQLLLLLLLPLLGKRVACSR